MNPVLIIKKKRDGKRLNDSEIRYFINSYKTGKIPDYQFSAFLMVIYFQGLDREETENLMSAMKSSGRSLGLSDIKGPKVDKHSTGGVGDKVSLVLAPLVASCGVYVPMISGRALGHTGGTLDKLESIPGFRTDLSIKQCKRQLKKIGVVMMGQTKEIAPVDKKIYALRDVTATVDSIPLIAASIMSKKLAEDLDGLVLDVKFGSGAFMKEIERARQLARTMVQLGRQARVKVIARLSNMDNPLGRYIGNSLEVIEAIEALKGRGPDDLMELTFRLGADMLKLAGIKGGIRLLKQKIKSGKALKKFQEIISYQGGNTGVIDNYSLLPQTRYSFLVYAPKKGYIHHIDTFQLGMLLTELGGGRRKKEDRIDHACGFEVYKKIGDFVDRAEPLAKIMTNTKKRIAEIRTKLSHTFMIMEKPCRHRRLIQTVIT